MHVLQHIEKQESITTRKLDRWRCPNIFPIPPSLARPGRTIYWRVDSIMANDTSDTELHRFQGPVWHFTFAPYPGPIPKPPGPCPENCVSIYENPDNVGLGIPKVQGCAQGYVHNWASIVVSDLYRDDAYTLKRASVCLSLKFNPGINKLGMVGAQLCCQIVLHVYSQYPHPLHD